MSAARPMPAATSRLTPTGPTYAVEAHELVKTYGSPSRTGSGVRALDGLSFTVEAGTVFGLLGPNGAGKTTTVKVLTTLARADAGTAVVAGLDVGHAAADVRRSIGFVSQRPQFDPQATGRENLVLQARLYGLSRAESRRRAEELLDRFGLAAAADRVARTYSGGMARRLDVALGLTHRPSVLFLDEPTTGLDPEARADMWDEIARLAGDEGLTVVLTTHNLDEADRLASRLAIVDRGRVVVTGTPEELKRELHGDAITVELTESHPDGRARAALERLHGVHDVLEDDRLLRARFEHGASAVPVVLGALEDVGVRVASVTIARPSLDDVYLRYAGRAFSADETAEATEVAA
ncbi:MAG TPA: ATP-binding cassette domain-containing protein [Actinopolymorphaceae bacterium]